MLFLCEYKLRPGVTQDDLSQRAQDLHQAGTSRQDLIETWYRYRSEGAGFMVLHADDEVQLQRVLKPYDDILMFEVKPALEEINYEDVVGVGRPSLGYAVAL